MLQISTKSKNIKVNIGREKSLPYSVLHPKS